MMDVPGKYCSGDLRGSNLRPTNVLRSLRENLMYHVHVKFCIEYTKKECKKAPVECNTI